MTTSDARRRCQPDESDDEGKEFLDLHLRVATLYTLVYGSLVGMPFCRESVETFMNESSAPLSLVFDGADPSVETPWGLAKTYFDEINEWMTENDGWNADGSANREYNRVPFSDYAVTDAEGNSWTPYIPRNTPWEVICFHVHFFSFCLSDAARAPKCWLEPTHIPFAVISTGIIYFPNHRRTNSLGNDLLEAPTATNDR